jgi:allantoicase
LAAVQYGGQAVSWSNRHYGHPRNLIVPGRGACMGDGWETARQPNRPAVYQKGPDGLMVLPGFDWALLKLGWFMFTRTFRVYIYYTVCNKLPFVYVICLLFILLFLLCKV